MLSGTALVAACAAREAGDEGVELDLADVRGVHPPQDVGVGGPVELLDDAPTGGTWTATQVG